MKKKYLFAVGILIIFSIFLTACGGSGGKSDTGPSKINAWIMAQDFMKQKLKAPSTAEFPGYSDEYVTNLGGDEFKVNSYVDAENAFGAKIRVHFTMTLKWTEDKIKVTSLQTSED